MEHIEQAGVHSGDSACSLPPYTLPAALQDELRRQTRVMALALKVVGLMNVQFAIQGSVAGQGEDAVVYVLEVNPRASRTVPYVSKATGQQLAKIAARCMAGQRLADQKSRDGQAPREVVPPYFSVKEAVFPFNKFPGVDPILGPEMRSTGEVMGIDIDFPTAFAKSQSAAGSALPKQGSIFVSVADRDKPQVVLPVRRLHQLGYKIYATSGTAEILERHGIETHLVGKESENREDDSPRIVELISSGKIDVVVNTPSGSGSAARRDGYLIRAATTAADKAIFTTIAQLSAAIGSFESVLAGPFKVKSLQEYATERAAAIG